MNVHTTFDPPHIDVQRNYYNQRWSADRIANPLERERAATILSLLSQTHINEPHILDLGCGTGWLSNILSHFGKTTAVDLSDEAISRARSRYPNVEFISGDFVEIDLTPSKFDVVVSQEVIEHFVDQEKFVASVASLVKPGGYLILTTPNRWTLDHCTQKDLDPMQLQPIEQWLTRVELHRLLSRHFNRTRISSIILGHGTCGLHRWVNSTKLNTLMRILGLSPYWDLARKNRGYGLHLVALALKK